MLRTGPADTASRWWWQRQATPSNRARAWRMVVACALAWQRYSKAAIVTAQPHCYSCAVLAWFGGHAKPVYLWWRSRQLGHPCPSTAKASARPGNEAPHGAFFLSSSRNLFRLRRENIIKRAVSPQRVERSHNCSTLSKARHTAPRLIVAHAPLRPAKLLHEGKLRDTSSSADLGNAVHLATSSWYGNKPNNALLFLQHV